MSLAFYSSTDLSDLTAKAIEIERHELAPWQGRIYGVRWINPRGRAIAGENKSGLYRQCAGAREVREGGDAGAPVH
jgi:hypothetical protein